MPSPSLRATLDAAFARLKLPGVAAFTPDPTSRVHENVQRFVASGLTEEHTWDTVVRPDRVNGLVVLGRRVETMADGRSWLEVAGSEDVVIALGIHDLEDEDPLLYCADMENAWESVTRHARRGRCVGFRSWSRRSHDARRCRRCQRC